MLLVSSLNTRGPFQTYAKYNLYYRHCSTASLVLQQDPSICHQVLSFLLCGWLVTYSYACRNIVNTIMTNETQFFRKIYLSHFHSKWYERVMCERWIGDWTKTATYWPQALPAIAALLSHPAVLLNLCWVWFSLLRTATTDSKLWSPTNSNFL